MHRMDIRTEGPHSDSDGEWSLYWTDRHTQVPGGFLPLLDEWADLYGMSVQRGDAHRARPTFPVGLMVT